MATGANGQGTELVLSLCIPLVLCFPAYAYVEFDHEYFWKNNYIMTAYGLGVVSYLAAAGLIYAGMVSRFDELSGRTVKQPEGYPPATTEN